MDRPTEGARPEAAPQHAIEILLVILVWTFFAALNVMMAKFNHHHGGPAGIRSEASVAGHVVLPAVWAVLTTVVLWLSRRVRLDGAFWRRRAAYVLAVGLVVAVVSDNVCDALWDAVARHAAGPGPSRDAHRFRPGLDNLTWLDDFGVFAVAVALGTGRGYVLRERARRDEARRREAVLEAASTRARADAAQLQAQLAEARLDALQRQLDPHFLFNTLNAVSALVERDPRGVRRMIGQLSDLLRHSMNGASASEVPLRQELALLERYVDIMRVRFAEHLAVETCVDPRALDALVPNMILQPLVENAIRHGIERRADGGRVEIEIALDSDALVLRVRDDGPDAAPGATATAMSGSAPSMTDGGGMGLHNTAMRLAQLYGSDQHLTLTRDSAGGTIAEVRLPHHTRSLIRPTDSPVTRGETREEARGETRA